MRDDFESVHARSNMCMNSRMARSVCTARCTADRILEQILVVESICVFGTLKRISHKGVTTRCGGPAVNGDMRNLQSVGYDCYMTALYTSLFDMFSTTAAVTRCIATTPHGGRKSHWEVGRALSVQASKSADSDSNHFTIPLSQEGAKSER